MCERSDKKCSPKNFLGPFRPQFGLKIRGGGGGGGGGASLDLPMLVSSSINAKTAIFK